MKSEKKDPFGDQFVSLDGDEASSLDPGLLVGHHDEQAGRIEPHFHGNGLTDLNRGNDPSHHDAEGYAFDEDEAFEPDDEDEEPEARARPSLVSKLILPVGFSVLGILVLGAGYAVFGPKSSETAPAVVFSPSPRVPAATPAPTGPSSQRDGAARVGQSDPADLLVGGREAAAPDALAPPLTQGNSIEPAVERTSVAPAGSPSGNGLQDRVAKLEGRLNLIETGQDQLTRSVKGMGDRIEQVGTSLSGLQGAIQQLQNARVAAAVPVTTAVPAAAVARPQKPARKVRSGEAPRKDRPIRRDHGAQAAVDSPATIRLKGVARGTALLETPAGMIQVAVGDAIPDVGKVTAIRKDSAGKWLVQANGRTIVQ